MTDYHNAPDEWHESDVFESCAVCGWKHPSSSTIESLRDTARSMTVLHVILKHPEVYHKATGKDAEEALSDYLLDDPDLRATQIAIATSEDPTAYLIQIGAVQVQ